MNILIQNILVLLVFGVAIGFLIKKFFWKSEEVTSSTKSNSSPCGNGGCGCH
ncbi:FeoB-associated Cys-rich membrane protein [Aquimarina addita]|uniref:FeoB-associated Cys-rich membrane protein n=1 Tax=Aquimarina addita TaxID=870485 RepID=UPI0031E91C3E